MSVFSGLSDVGEGPWGATGDGVRSAETVPLWRDLRVVVPTCVSILLLLGAALKLTFTFRKSKGSLLSKSRGYKGKSMHGFKTYQE